MLAKITTSCLMLLFGVATALPGATLPSSGRVLDARASTNINPDAIRDTNCINGEAVIDFHDMNVATLGICGGIQGAIQKCGGSPQSTTGESGTAKFTLTPTVAGATINVSKGRWEGCIRAARAVCPAGSFESVCKGGASEGDIAFTLDNP